jgi:large subunit ribosomal protein L25
MKLQVSKRASLKKSESKKIRRAGNIPAILYHRGKEGEPLIVDGTEFTGFLRKVQPGRLSTTTFTLETNGKGCRAILKDIQYDPTTYDVIHLDFEELLDDVAIKVKVPIECTGVVDCIGVKLGGTLRQVIRYLRVSCLPKDMPTVFQVDIKAMAVNEVKRLGDLGIPETVRPLADLKEVAVVIAKR